MRREGRRGEMRGSVVDLFLLFLLLLSLVSGLIRWQESRARSEEGLKTYRAVLLSETMVTESADCLEVGEWLFDPSGERVGRVTGISRVSAPLTLETDGGILRGEWEASKRCRLRVELEATGGERGGVLLLGGTSPLAVGGERVLFSERMRLQARLLAYSEQTP